jgi:hypothetical protein
MGAVAVAAADRLTLARMEVALHANICDLATERIAQVLCEVFEPIAKDLHNDYGGTMQHLWIDFELVENHAERRKPFPFRFQKKVGGGIFEITGTRTPVYENVGHYSVRPDFQRLKALPLDSVATYALNLIYASTSVLIEKEKRLGGFDARRFRSDLVSSCRAHGHEIDGHTGAG